MRGAHIQRQERTVRGAHERGRVRGAHERGELGCTPAQRASHHTRTPHAVPRTRTYNPHRTAHPHTGPRRAHTPAHSHRSPRTAHTALTRTSHRASRTPAPYPHRPPLPPPRARTRLSFPAARRTTSLSTASLIGRFQSSNMRCSSGASMVPLPS
eukprot:7387975-Prymnesium_polylepis.1